MQAPRDHQVNDDPKLAIQTQGDPFANPAQSQHFTTVAGIQRRLERAHQKRAIHAHPLQPPFGASCQMWRTELLDPSGLSLPGDVGPSVEGSTRLLLEVTAGRADVPAAIRGKEIAVHDLNGLLALAPIVEQVPGIPGRGALVGAIRATTAVSAVLRRLPFGRRPT